MRNRRVTWVVAAAVAAVLAIVGVSLTPSSASADTFSDPAFTTEVVATVPPYTLVGLALAPDGRMFAWQKNGVVRIVKDGVLLSTPFMDLSSRVNTYDDRASGDSRSIPTSPATVTCT